MLGDEYAAHLHGSANKSAYRRHSFIAPAAAYCNVTFAPQPTSHSQPASHFTDAPLRLGIYIELTAAGAPVWRKRLSPPRDCASAFQLTLLFMIVSLVSR